MNFIDMSKVKKTAEKLGSALDEHIGHSGLAHVVHEVRYPPIGIGLFELDNVDASVTESIAVRCIGIRTADDPYRCLIEGFDQM